MNNKISKKLVYFILKKEIIEHQINPQVLALTNLENLYEIIKTNVKKYHTDQNLKLYNIIKDIISEIRYSKIAIGYSTTNKIKILLKNLKKYNKNKNQYLWNLVNTTYHEIKHILIDIEEYSNPSCIEYYYLTIENLLRRLTDCYPKYHDEFYEEIMANRYALKKTISFLEEYSKETIEELTKYIKAFTINQKIYYTNYDIEHFLNYIDFLIKEKGTIKDISKNTYPYYIVHVLYQKNTKFKSLEELSKELYWLDFPLEIKYLIISSRPYLDDIDYNTLPKEDLEFILKAINYNYKLELKKSISNKKIRTRLTKLINNTKKTNPTYPYYLLSMPILEQKEINNQIKLQYLKQQKTEIEKLLNKPKVKKRLASQES